MIFKQKVYNTFLESLNKKIDSYQHAIDELSESILNETKSTAGDKHETALAILQSEQSRLAVHLYEAHDQKSFFSQINYNDKHNTIHIGSLVKTNKGYYFISVALPKIIIYGNTILAISANSPLGKKLLGKKVGESIDINNIIQKIESIE